MKSVPLIIAIYIRLSFEGQVRGEFTSLDHQEAYCRKYAEERDWIVYEVFVDRGISGERSDRAGYRRLKEAIRSGRIGCVLAYKLERVGRNAAEGLAFHRFMTDHGCKLITVTNPQDRATPTGKFLTTVEYGVAELERDNLSEKITLKQTESAKRGYKTGGLYPVGYRPGERSGVPVIDEIEAAFVRRIFIAVAEGVALGELARQLTEERIYTRVRQIRKRGGEIAQVGGKPYRSDCLRRIIQNPMYKGYVQYGEIFTKGLFEAVIDEKLWAAANQKLDENQGNRQPRIQERDRWFHPLKGLLFCGSCASVLTPAWTSKKDSSGRPYRYYACQGAVRNGSSETCSGCRVPASLFENIIAGFLGEVAKHPEMVAHILGAVGDKSVYSKRKLSSQRRQRLNAVEAIDKKLANLRQVAMEVGTTGFGKDLIKQAGELDREREGILAEIHHLTREIEADESAQMTLHDIQANLARFEEILGALPEDEQRELVRLMIQRITITQDSKQPGSDRQLAVSIELTKDFTALGSRKQAKVTFTVEMRRSKAYWAEISGPVQLTVGAPEAPRQARPKTITSRHEIHKALKALKEIERKGWSFAEYARRQGLSRPAVTKLLNWTKLEPECQEILRGLRDSRLIRRVGRKQLPRLLDLSGKAQVEALRKAIREEELQE